MGVRAEHLIGVIRRLDAIELVLRLFVLDQMAELIELHIGSDAADEIQEHYQKWTAEEGDYNEFEKLFKDIISEAEDLTETVKYRFQAYLDFLFPPPMPA